MTPPAHSGGPTRRGSPGEDDRSLARLARAHGLQRAYHDLDGRAVPASREALVGVLGALGVPAATPAEREESLRAVAVTRDARLGPVVAWSAGATAPAFVGRGAPLPQHLLVRHESGTEERVALDGLLVECGRRVRLALERLGLELGYHELVVPGADDVLLVVAPRRLPLPSRGFGVFAPLYALRGEADWGIGSLAELAELVGLAAEHGASFVGTLPLYAFAESPVLEASPYRPVSRLAWNECYLDVARLPEVAASQEARAHLETPEFQQRLETARSGSRVDYASVLALKREVLERCAAVAASGPRSGAFDRFLSAHPEVARYAEFRSSHAPDPVAAAAYHRFVQFAMDAALGELAQQGDTAPRLYLDLPIGVHPDGYDPFAYASSFALGATVGAPPDPFFSGGQNWSIPALHPGGLRADRYRYFIASLRHVLGVARYLRLDHVMGLERSFLIPAGHTPTDGAYVASRSAELHAIVRLEAHRHRSVVIGEDLGTVPPATRAAMARDGLLGSFVVQFEASAAAPLPRSPRRALASFGTHDLPRFAAWIDGADLVDEAAKRLRPDGELEAARAARRAIGRALGALGGQGPSAAYRGLLELLAASRAALVLADLGDLLGDPERDNVPGPDGPKTSWRHRFALPVRALYTHPGVRAGLDRLSRRRQGAAGAAN